ncbi:MAG: DMT family transporter [Actinomycetota bacterium]|nr:DMT family transporter [Actinomycetota bacterium]
MLAVSLAVLSAALWGGADFLGGFTAKRMAVLVVTLLSQLSGLVAVTAVVLVTGSPVSVEGAQFEMAAGLVGSLTFAVFYAALAAGAMSLVAPLSACGAVVPVGVAIARGDVPGPLAFAGIVVALAGIALIARRDDAALVLTGRVVALAAGAALGIGVVLTLLQQGADAGGSSGLSVVAVARAASVCVTALAVAATRTRLAAARGSLGPIAAVGVLDTGANALFAVASEQGSDALVALLGSLYPVTTVMLARLVLAERLTARQAVGVGLAVAGAALVSTG